MNARKKVSKRIQYLPKCIYYYMEKIEYVQLWNERPSFDILYARPSIICTGEGRLCIVYLSSGSPYRFQCKPQACKRSFYICVKYQHGGSILILNVFIFHGDKKKFFFCPNFLYIAIF